MSTRSQSPRSVGLDAHLLSSSQTYRGAGINGYIYQLLRHLPLAESAAFSRGGTLQYTAYLHDPAFVAPAGIAVCRSRWDTSSPWRRIVWEQTYLAVHTRHQDLLHGLAFAVPLAAACPTVVTVHDLSFIHYPDAFRPFKRLYLSLITRASTRRAARVITVSKSTRQDVIALCGVPGEKVIAIPNGVTEDFSPANPSKVAEFRQRRGLPEHFILFLGTLEPRKNLVRLIDAYALWRQTAYPAGHGSSSSVPALVIAGGKGWFYDQIFARVTKLGLTQDVIFPGFVPGEELPWFYRAAELFIYPSLFEGFGLPVLEALACGTPTITSAVSSLPEVAGNAALLVNPENTGDLADAMGEVLSNPALAAQLRAAGPRQARQFSWARTAIATAAVYRAVLADTKANIYDSS